MAQILCIETSSTVCSVALGDESGIIALKEEAGGYTHAENLSVFIEEVMKGRALSSLDAIAVSKGPGSYTGLRIGVATAKGLCFSLNKPLVSVSTLEAMYLGMMHEQKDPELWYCPMLDARRMEVYCAVYERGEERMPVCAKIIEEDSFSELLSKHKILFFGEGAAKCRDIIRHPNALFSGEKALSAANLLPLAQERFQRNACEDIAYFEPLYLKDFVGGKRS